MSRLNNTEKMLQDGPQVVAELRRYFNEKMTLSKPEELAQVNAIIDKLESDIAAIHADYLAQVSKEPELPIHWDGI